ncbi:MAG: tetrahydrofolate dehydrogenase/cyclohydrolase catalytic domain-containing protein [Terriglobales bacterium]
MPAILMYGKPVAEAIEHRVARGVEEFLARHHLIPTLAIVQVGDNPASERYLRRKMDACARLGMKAEVRRLSASISASSLKEEVSVLSGSPEVHGIHIELPLPRHIEEPEAGATDKFDVLDAIDSRKDVDGVSRGSIPELYRAQQHRLRFLPGTALAVRRMISHYGIKTEGRKAVVVGRNDITAKPILHMLGGRMCNAAAIWCHRYVPRAEQEKFIRDADILVTSVGNPKYQIHGSVLKRGVVVFDIATRLDPSTGKLTGDVELESARAVASHITPVPGGVGPVTVAALTENLLRAANFCLGSGEPGYEF